MASGPSILNELRKNEDFSSHEKNNKTEGDNVVNLPNKTYLLGTSSDLIIKEYLVVSYFSIKSQITKPAGST